MARKIKYPSRHLADLSDKEIRTLCKEIFNPEYVSEIDRSGDDEVRVTIATVWGEEKELVEDVVTLTDIDYHVDWFILPAEMWQYRQYLFSVGVCPLARDNPYL